MAVGCGELVAVAWGSVFVAVGRGELVAVAWGVWSGVLAGGVAVEVWVYVAVAV